MCHFSSHSSTSPLPGLYFFSSLPVWQWGAVPRLSALSHRDRLELGCPKMVAFTSQKHKNWESHSRGEAFSASLFSNCDFLSIAAENDCLNCAAHYAYLCGLGLLCGLLFKMIEPWGETRKQIQHQFICISLNILQLWFKWREMSLLTDITCYMLHFTMDSCLKSVNEGLGNPTTTFRIWIWILNPKCKQSHLPFSSCVINCLRCIALLQNAVLCVYSSPDIIQIT